MYSIGDFSKACGLTVKTLRFYHERGLLVPAEVDPHTGYRRYDTRNLETAQVIRALREFEFSLDDIAVILNECGEDEDLIRHLKRHQDALQAKLAHYRDLVKRIDRVVLQERQLQETLALTTGEVRVKQVEPVRVAGIRMTGRYAECGPVFGKLARQLGRHIAGKPMCLYYDGEYREEDADFEPCFPVSKTLQIEGIHVRELPAVTCVTLIHPGPYETLRAGRTPRPWPIRMKTVRPLNCRAARYT